MMWMSSAQVLDSKKWEDQRINAGRTQFPEVTKWDLHTHECRKRKEHNSIMIWKENRKANNAGNSRYAVLRWDEMRTASARMHEMSCIELLNGMKW